MVLLLCWAPPAIAQTDPPAERPKPAAVTPPIPKLQSPISRFRELLFLSPAERRQALTNWGPEKREKLVAFIREYSVITAEERDSRLNSTELYWFLTRLLPMNPTNRAAFLPDVPEAIRSSVESRLQQWDLYPPQLQKEILMSERSLKLLTQRGSNSVDVVRRSLEGLPTSQRLNMQIKLARFDGMNDAQRSRAFASLNKFFDLSPEEKERALRTLSEAERVEMEKTLNTFANLPTDKRAQCVRSFEKFAGMSPSERGLFLKNAQQWETMSPTERASWRNLINTIKLMPPLPYPRVRTPPPSVPSTPELIPGH